MSQAIDVNGQSINYPETGDTNWGDEATDFAVQTSAAFGKLGLASGTSVDIAQTLDVAGNTTLDANLSVGGNTTLTGNLTANGNTTLGNANTDTITVTGILNVDSGVLYVDPTNNRIGINDSSPSEALDITGNVIVSGNLTVDANLIKTDSTSNFVGINTTNPTVALDVTGDVKQSGVVLNSDGTVSAPSVTFTSDTNTGLYRIGSDKIGIATNGTKVGEIGSGYGGFIGNILQIQSKTKTDTFTTASFNSFEDITGLNISITPKFSNSKILILYNVSGYANGGSIKLVRDSTDICIGDTAGSRIRATINTMDKAGTGAQETLSGNFLDSPNTTSAINYKIQLRPLAAVGYVNRSSTDTDSTNFSRGTSSITVMELMQ